jgi:hypothetical protein
MIAHASSVQCETDSPNDQSPCWKRGKAAKSGVMNLKRTVALLIASSAIAVGNAQSTGPSDDEIARTIQIALKIGTSETLTDTEKQYGPGLRLLDRQGPVVTSIQGPLNRIFLDVRNALARRRSYTTADVSAAAREPVIVAIALPNGAYQFWDTRGPVQISEIMLKVSSAGRNEPQVIHAAGGCLFNPLDYKKPTGDVYKARLATCKFPLNVFASPGARFEVAVVHDQGEWSRPLQPEELRLVR